MGEVRYKKNQETGIRDFIIDCYSGSGTHHKFVIGHEEGHLVDFTGDLVTLWHTAKKLDYEFDFLTEDYAQASDNATHRIYNEEWTEENLAISWHKPFNIKELIAHISGLIALRKINTDSTLIDKIEKAIQTGKEYNVRIVINKLP